MRILKSIIFSFGLILLFGVNTFAQDKMASLAPVDRQLKAVDSVTIQRVIARELTTNVSDIYPDWNHEHVNGYKNVEKPDNFKIDLTGFSMPTPSRLITSNFGYRSQFRRNHYGLDIKVYTGDTIYAAFNGKARIVSYDRRGYGYYIVLRHPNGLETVYGHLSKQLIKVDQVVKSGQPIGLGGNTGRSYGSHLHFETRFLGEAINPALLFDFANQDVTGDYYMFHSGSNNNSLANRDNSQIVGASELVDQDWEADSYEQQTASLMANKNASDNNATLVPVTNNSSQKAFYKVKKGDSLYSIAKVYDISIDRLCALNGISKRSKLRLGQILKCK